MSLQIASSYYLKDLNTFRIDSIAKYFCELKYEAELEVIIDFIEKKKEKFFILGGGSNILLPDFFDGVVICNRLKGITKIREDEKFVYLSVMAGEGWDDFVKYALENSWFGLENLSLIPGTVGASPVQNISAYGVEVKEFIDAVEVFDLTEKRKFIIKNEECNFSYRNSIFKAKHNLIVLSVLFRLKKKPDLNLSYKDIKEEAKKYPNFTALDLRNSVITIRKNKLPDPLDIPNLGSFFHNPIVDNQESMRLKKKYPTLPIYEIDDKQVKLSAGWLIENSELKGVGVGNVGVYSKHALILVNYGKATQKEVLSFAAYIQKKVVDKFGVSLHIEPIIF